MPAGGYDTGTLANDLVALMDALGHERFAVVGHDTGFAISYALAADHPDRVERVALAEIPGSPGAAPSPPVFVPGPINDRLWHLPFNRLEKINEQLVAGREDIFFGWEFDAAAKKLPDDVDRLLRRPAHRPRRAARQLRVVPGARRDDRAGRAAQDPAADHARPGDRRRVELRRSRRGRDEARRGRRPGRRHPGRRPLRRRGGAGRDAGGADAVPDPVPRRAPSRPPHETLPPPPRSMDNPDHGALSALDSAPVWLNTEPLTAAGLRGRVVLVDVWTYSCVNWLRTLPYVRAWHERYRDRGLVVVGVHAPEFGFEHDLDNVRRAVAALDVGYPVVIDNDFAIWRSLDNHYWPAVYLRRRGRSRPVPALRRGGLRGDRTGHPAAPRRGRGARRRRRRRPRRAGRLGCAAVPGDLPGLRPRRA